VIAFGTGGTKAEFWKDIALTVLPITTTKAENLIKRTKISQILEKGWRNIKPCDVGRIEDILVAFGDFLETHPEVAEVDINPLIVSTEKIVALDARIILREKHDKNDE